MEFLTLLRKLVWQDRKQSPIKYFRATLVHILRKQGDCPVCLLCEERLKKFYWWYFYEKYGGPPWIIRVLKSNGFCNKHAWDMVEMKKKNQMSFVYGYLVRDALRKLEKMASQGDKSRKNIGPANICPICEEISTISTLWTQQLVEHLEDTEIKELYFGSSGLCMNHFYQTFYIASSKARLLLIQKQSSELNRLKDGLEQTRGTLADQSYGPDRDKIWVKVVEFFASKDL
ncbi:MAG TPA: DUF6062 family protein [Thermodesulfobacteriota bacterium]